MLLPWFPSLHILGPLSRYMSVVLGYLLAVDFILTYGRFKGWEQGQEIAAVMGLALTALIVVRINSANERWWEGRKLWGQLINETRNLALKVRAHVDATPDERRRFGELLIEFPWALREHLQLPAPRTEPPRHGPGHVALQIHQMLNRWNRDGRLDDRIRLLDVHARAFMDICGACERIRNTPLASSFRALLRWGILLNILGAPWVLYETLTWVGIPLLSIGFAFLLGVELTAEEIEEPFGEEADDLPLTSYCQTIARFIEDELIAEPPTPNTAPA